jgi:hypothetical protein
MQTIPDTLTKLEQLGNTTRYEPSGDRPLAEQKRVPYQSRSLDECITNVVNDPIAEARGWWLGNREPVVVQPKLLISQAGKRSNSVGQVKAPSDATSV